jgi:hypothetical protein
MFFGPGTPASQEEMGNKGFALNIGDALAKLGVSDALKPVAVTILKNQQGGHVYALPFDVQVPPGTTALIDLPGHDGPPIEVGSGRHHFAGAHPTPPTP